MTTLNAGEGKVEEIARALADGDFASRDTFQYFFDQRPDEYLAIVRFVLTALRTPSEEMVEAMRERVDLADWALRAIFTGAIDVLLTPKDPEQ